VVKVMRGQMAQLVQTGGVGIEPGNRDGHALVEKVKPDSPAAKAGVRPGELLVTIDGKAVAELGSTALSVLLGGAVAADVSVGFGARGGGTRTVTLRRVPRAGMM